MISKRSFREAIARASRKVWKNWFAVFMLFARTIFILPICPFPLSIKDFISKLVSYSCRRSFHLLISFWPPSFWSASLTSSMTAASLFSWSTFCCSAGERNIRNSTYEDRTLDFCSVSSAFPGFAIRENSLMLSLKDFVTLSAIPLHTNSKASGLMHLLSCLSFTANVCSFLLNSKADVEEWSVANVSRILPVVSYTLAWRIWKQYSAHSKASISKENDSVLDFLCLFALSTISWKKGSSLIFWSRVLWHFIVLR